MADAAFKIFAEELEREIAETPDLRMNRGFVRIIQAARKAAESEDDIQVTPHPKPIDVEKLIDTVLSDDWADKHMGGGLGPTMKHDLAAAIRRALENM